MKRRLKSTFLVLAACIFIFGCFSSDDPESAGTTGTTGTTGDTGDTGTTGSGETVNIAVAELSSIDFVSATPETIALKGTGGAGRLEASTLIFRVRDTDGNVVQGATVNFELSSTQGGLSLDPASAVTDTLGQARTTVTSGSVGTSVRVRAFIAVDASTEISVFSSNLVVSTGLPDQDSFSLSIETFNPEALRYDGEEVTVNIRAGDNFNNLVADGTVVYFTTEGGSIEPYCETLDGGCSVVWTSQNPRPFAGAGDFEPRDGRVTILAVAIGEESFTDNGDSAYTLADAWDSVNDDLPDAWLDLDEDWVFDSGSEGPRDFDLNGSFTANGIYNGILCSDAAETAGQCTKQLIEVRDSIVMVMSDSYASVGVSLAGLSATISVADLNGNAMPVGSTVVVTPCSVCTIESGSTASFTVGNQTEPSSFNVTFTAGSTGRVTVTTPKGIETTYNF